MSAFRNTPTETLEMAAEALGELITCAVQMVSRCDIDPDELLLYQHRYRQMHAELAVRARSVITRQARRARNEVQYGTS